MEKTPCPNVGGPNMGGHVIPQCLVTDRITIKLQLTGTCKSRLIFKLKLVNVKIVR